MNSTSLPRWEQLPEIDLYLDQVLLYVNQITTFNHTNTINGQKRDLTASMINNYVKHGFLDKPQKKKYGKHQIARLIAITILKNAFPIQEISKVLEKLQEESSSEALYNLFVDYWNTSQVNNTPEIIINACQTIQFYYKTIKLMTLTSEEL
ncbi:hypothetical protein AT575_03630 [Streptococcus penaeicida]|uniref:DUF1836 domain-containing protein n=1 Tax=Streptococcus penaeicida TaxID=1765960 RepID=A0A2N8LCV0_9STRE|nr:DUF1836 domain-containing protein [Streptococcus penaeicida]PND47977.1 hypothetical protein AT575_03630 [Streptococcus penaeicida]